MTDLERIAYTLWQAQAIHATGFPRRTTWDDESKQAMREWAPLARAALLAIREPSEAAISAGVKHRLRTAISGENNWRQDTVALWQVMVDAMLIEGVQK